MTPLQRIGDAPSLAICTNPEHDPPSLIHLEPGQYKHTCPGCGREYIFAVSGTTC